MIAQALLNAAPVRNAFDRAMLTAHGVMLEHGFVCIGVADPESGAQPLTITQPDGSVSLQILPPAWNSAIDSFSFGYVHPTRASAEVYTLKAVVIGSSLAIHAASSVPGADLLTVTFNVAAETEVTQSDIKDWQDKMASGIVLRLLARQSSTTRLGKVLDPNESAQSTNSQCGGTKRPAPQDDRPRPGPFGPDNPNQPFFPIADPFSPGFMPSTPMWTPYGGLLGPRHPAWGQGVPVGGRGGLGGGMMPRFSPIGPGTGEPDPDHLRVPGMTPGSFPGFQGGASGGRMDPDGMFMMM